jgi:hypothetical protein
MAWTLTAQLTTGTYTVLSTDQIWWTAGTDNTSANYVVVGNYQDGTHIYASNGTTHQCSTNHVHNTKYIDSTHMSLDGAASALLSTLTTANTGLKFVFDTSDLGGASVTTSGAKFYAYDGTTDANAMAGITFQAAVGGTSSSWVAAHGSGAALTFADQSTATSHTFYVATSASPSSTGAKTGKVKFLLTYV